MVRISALIPKELDDRLRKYIARRFGGHAYGAISQVIQEAVDEYLSRRGVETEKEA